MKTANWIRRLFNSSGGTPASTRGFGRRATSADLRRLNRPSLRVESLEDRTVPALLTVRNTNDSGAGSLRNAIAMAQSGDVIECSPSLTGQTINLTSGQLVINSNVTIYGPGIGLMTINGDNASRVFDIQSGQVDISEFIITGGNGLGDLYGGGIYSAGNLTLNLDVVTGNSFQGGLGIGGGIYNSQNGTLTVTNSTISNNQAFQGGGIYNDGGTTSVSNCTLNGNAASSSGIAGGGGISNAGALTLLNDTIAGNAASGPFGSDGGGVSSSGSATLTNTIVATNSAAMSPDFYGAAPSGGYNLVGGNPMLGPLQNNGGPTPTMELLAGSPAINSGTYNGALPYDQRGLARYGGVNIGAYQASATNLVVSGFPSPSTAGVAGNVAITAEDTFGKVARGYLGVIQLTSSDGNAGLPGDYAIQSSDYGVHSLAVTLKTGGIQSITATDASNSTMTGTQSGIIVNPSTATSLTVTGFSSTATAGVAGNVTVTAEDAFGNTASSYTGTVHFTSSDIQAGLPANYTFTSSDHGSHTFSTTLKTAGLQSLTATDTVNGTITGTETGITVNPGPASTFIASGFPTSITAGGAGAVTITAKDPYGNIATGYTGTVHLSSSDPQAVLVPDYQFTSGDQGSHQFGAVFRTAGNESLTATDTANASLTATQSGINVAAGPAVSLAETSVPTTVTAGAATSFTVAAKDLFGNIATGYTGTVHFTSSDPQAVLPADYTFTAADAGSHTFSPTFKSAGFQTLTVTDTVNGALTATNSGLTEFNVPTSGSHPISIAAGPDGNLWFAEYSGNKIGKITPSGVITEYSLPGENYAGDITAGPDGNLWFTGNNDVGKITPNGAVTIYQLPNPNSGPGTIVSGPGGNLWFNEFYGHRIGEISPAGVLTEFSLGGAVAPRGITVGSDGNLWFSDFQYPTQFVGEMTLNGVVTQFADSNNANIQSVATGPDGNVWFTDALGQVGKVTPSGVITTYATPSGGGASGITAGPDGNVWVTEGNNVARVSPTGVITEYAVPTFNSFPSGIATGSDGNLWFTEYFGNKIGRLNPGVLVNAATASTMTVSGFPSTTTAGNSGSVTVTLDDAYGNVASGYTGTIHFTSSDAHAALPTDYTFTAADRGTHTFSIALDTAGAQTITVTDTATPSLTSSQAGITVHPAAASVLVMSGVPSSVNKITPFSFAVTAEDAFGNTATGYSGTVHFSSGDPAAALPTDYTFTAADQGSHTFSATFGSSGTQAIGVADAGNNGIAAAQSNVSVIAPAVLSLTGFSTQVTAGTPGTFTVTVLDASEQVDTGYRGTIHFTSSDSRAVLPADYTFTAADAGVHVFNATLNTVGPQTITATDAANALTGTNANVTEFTIPSPVNLPNGITSGPDGNLWFAEFSGNSIGKITTAGAVTEYALPTPNSEPNWVAAGPDGNVWFTEFQSDKIGKITPSGVITEYAVPTTNAGPEEITAGPGGNLWFTEFNAGKIGRITPSGVVTEFTLETNSTYPEGITAGPDGNLWFTESGLVTGNRVGKITPTGQITDYALSHPDSGPDGIATGPDGNLWFAEGNGGRIARVTTAGVITEFALPQANASPFGITAGPDGNLWFADVNTNLVGRITPAGVISEYTTPTAGSTPFGIAAGPDGALWFSELSKIGRLNPTINVVSAAPTVQSVVVNDGTAQRSEVRSITVTFSGPVTFAGGNVAAAFQLTHLTDSNNVNLNAAVSTNSQGQSVVTLTFSGSETDPVSGRNGAALSLADGRYSLTIFSASVSGPGGQALNGGGADGNYVSPTDTQGGGPGELHLYRLFGDATGDGIVDALDLGLFRSAFNTGPGSSLYLSYLDADNSGSIDAQDLGQFRTRYDVSVF